MSEEQKSDAPEANADDILNESSSEKSNGN